MEQEGSRIIGQSEREYEADILEATHSPTRDLSTWDGPSGFLESRQGRQAFVSPDQQPLDVRCPRRRHDLEKGSSLQQRVRKWPVSR